MIRQEISKQIWELKYRNKDETEEKFYKRIPNGLFGNLSNEELEKYNEIIKTCDFRKDCEYGLIEHFYSLAGRGMYAVGTDRIMQTFSNCFVLGFKKDSLSAIMDTAHNSAMTMKAGGGVGYSISILRPEQAMISTSKTTSSGAVSFLKILDSTCSVIKAGNSRRGAQMATMGIWHPDIKKFITAKRNGDLKNFNLSVFVSDEFMEAKNNDQDWNLIFPDIEFEKYDSEWDGNIKLWKSKGYPVKIYETVKAKELWDLIMKSNYNFAEPGILFEDIINSKNPLFYEEYIDCCNPCAEQPLIKNGSCNLGQINLSTHVKNMFTNQAEIDWRQLQKSVQIMVLMLDKLLDIGFYPLEEQAIVVQEKRMIGLGFTGLGDMLSKLCIPYGSPKSIELTEKIMKFISETAYLTSSKLAKEFGKFPAYNEKILDSYNVKQLDSNIKEHIKKYGLRNSRLTSLAPVGTISILLNNCSSGIEPNFALEYTRKIIGSDGNEFYETVESDAWNLFKNSEFYNGTIPEYFKTAQDLKPIDHINVQAAAQKWCCTAISKTVNCPEDISFEEFKGIYDLAYEKGLKGCTTYRPNNILGSILEVKKDPKTTKEEQDEFFDIWKNHEDGQVRIDDVSLPSEYPMKGYKIRSEGKKWYIHVAFKDKKCKKPFAIFATTNNREREVNAYNAIEKLTYLAEKCGIRKELIEQNEQKSVVQTNVNKICRMIGLLLRHNVPIIEIVKTLDNIEVPVSSFIFRIKKFLLSFVDKIEPNGLKCPECGAPLKFESGCQSCTECFWSKCA